MPTYEYECAKCKNQFEVFQRITAKPTAKCPKCGGGKVKRVIGTGSGILFKGSGFYATDYRSDSYKKAATADKPDTSSKSTSSSSDAKPAKAAAKDK